MSAPSAGPRDLIVTLNSLGVGDLDVLRARLNGVRGRLEELGQSELSGTLAEALDCLEGGRTSDYRRLVSQVVSRLGHLRAG